MRPQTQAAHLAHRFDATLSLDSGREDAAIASLRRALAVAKAPAHSLGLITTRHQLGMLIGGDEGRALIEEARAALAAHQVRQPEAMMRLF